MFRTYVMIVCCAVLFPALCNANEVLFDLQWDGSVFGNNATASGQITINTELIANPGTNLDIVGGALIPELSVVIEGASSGNGTFFESGQIGFVEISTASEVDFSTELVGQDGLSSFTVFSLESGGPVPVNNFTIQTDLGLGDQLQLTSFRPAGVVPEPSLTLLLPIIASVAFRRKR